MPTRLGMLLVTLAVCGCQHRNATPPMATASDAANSSASTAEAAHSAAPASDCPPPKHSTDACAAVMTYAKSPSGTCCAYPSPCAVPLAGQQYSDEACTHPAGK